MEGLFIAILVASLAVIMITWGIARKNKKAKPQKQEPPTESIQESVRVQEFAKKRGREGEERISRILSSLPRQDYIVLNDVLLPTDRGTTQLDHIVVSVYGIFVIEVKNYQGQIYGRKDGEEWKKYINGKEYRFLNPLLQNKTHAKAVAQAIGTGTANIVPLTVFTGSAVLKITDFEQVIYEYSLLQTIELHKARVFTPEQAERYARLIDDAIEENRETVGAHVRYVREVASQKDREVSMGYCPRCSGRLVLRKGKYGDFYGCSNYPECKYTKNI